jgi:hypothetical protein
VNRWSENEIIETRVGQNPCGLKRLADTFPGLTDEEKEMAREDMREKVRPLFVYIPTESAQVLPLILILRIASGVLRRRLTPVRGHG